MSDILTGPTWAKGCKDCTFGLALDAPIPRNGMMLVEVRRMQFREGIIAFCECEAGQAYERFVKAEPQPPAKSVPVERPKAPRAHIHETERIEELQEVYA